VGSSSHSSSKTPASLLSVECETQGGGGGGGRKEEKKTLQAFEARDKSERNNREQKLIHRSPQ
jgi:hypothetical protein